MKNSPVPTSHGDRNARFRRAARRRRPPAVDERGSTGRGAIGVLGVVVVVTRLLGSAGLGDVGVDLLGGVLETALQVVLLAGLEGVAEVLQRQLVGAAVGAGRRGVAVRVGGDGD